MPLEAQVMLRALLQAAVLMRGDGNGMSRERERERERERRVERENSGDTYGDTLFRNSVWFSARQCASKHSFS
jgi:hypothetical protein